MAQIPTESEGKSRRPPGATEAGPIQAVAGGMAGWFLGLAVCLGVLAAGAAYYGLLVAASTLVSIFVVLLTLYLFLRYWPEEDVIARRQAPPVSAPAQTPRQARVSAVRVGGPPRARFMVALKEVVRRQEAFRLSPQGAERFARTIRYLLRSDDGRRR